MLKLGGAKKHKKLNKNPYNSKVNVQSNFMNKKDSLKAEKELDSVMTAEQKKKNQKAIDNYHKKITLEHTSK